MQPPHFLVLFGLCSVSILFNVCSSFSLNAISRRDAIAAVGTFIVFPGNVKPAEAFDNSMDRTKFKDRPKVRDVSLEQSESKATTLNRRVDWIFAYY